MGGIIRRKNSLFVKKPCSLPEKGSADDGLKRSLGPLALLLLGVGSIIGAGIYVLTGAAAASFAGPGVLFSFVIAGFACVFAGLCYSELASSMPVTGSAYVYAYSTLGELPAWILGWLLVLEYGVAGSLVAVGFSGYFVSLLASFGIVIPEALSTPFVQSIPTSGGYSFVAGGGINLIAAIAVLIMATPLLFGLRNFAIVNSSIVLLKILVLLVFVAFGFSSIIPDHFSPLIPENEGGFAYGWQGVFRAASMIFFAYIGFETVSTAAAEAKKPQRDLPIGILGSLAVCTLIYMAVAAVLIGIVPFRELNVPDPLALAVDHIGKPWLLFFVKVGAVIGLTSILMSTCYGQSRIFFAMARDGLLPQAFMRLHKKHQTPWVGTIIIASCMAFAAGALPITLLGDLISIGVAATFSIVCLSVISLRNTAPELERPFKVPFGGFRIRGYWIGYVPAFGIFMCLFMITPLILDLVSKAQNGNPLPVLLLAGFIGVGASIYVFYGYRNSRMGSVESIEVENGVQVISGARS
ncbi:amino acid permease [Hyphococcus sp. DH-69]|uniref:amino acid permease n=1 Tax=Hyphococcus formosus TaxID=3143534 RepID=UPI00398B653E